MSEQHNPHHAAAGLEPNSRDGSLASDAQPRPRSPRQDNKKYQCPCGSTMSRSDVLLRHIRKCDKARDTLERSGSASRRPSRCKSACNECATSKLKCDSQTPCSRCKKKSLRCLYTRNGYSDPYKIFRIPTAAPVAERAVESRSHQPQSMNTESPASILPMPPGNATSTAGPIDELEFGGLDFNAPFEYMNASFLSADGSTSMNDAFQDLDWDSLLTFPECPDNVVRATSPPATLSGLTETSSAVPKEPLWNFTEGFHLQQIDSVEAKCVEMRSYMAGFQTGIGHTILSYTSRDRLVDCIRLYAKCYQSIQPILHLPTFELTKTPPDLLAAMMLVGACYSSNVIPPTIVVQGAIHMLLVLQYSSHERAMGAPPLASIQANALLCQVLILTRNPQAYYFATMHRSRTISMAERAGLFCASDAMDHWDLDQHSFDWHRWSQLEMRRRLAHHIFVDDMGSNIFTRTSSHMSPFTFHIDTPCYNDSWVAPTASECLEKLRGAPPPIQVATAVKKLRSASSLNGPHLFDASDCGMLEIIVALHGILFRTMEEALDDENNVPPDREPASSTQATDVNLWGLLNRDLLNCDIANIANEIVDKYGSGAIRRVNGALDAWLRNWNARRARDIYDERHAAFTHPLNFWLLAKLFLVLHFFRNRCHRDTLCMGEDGQQERESELHVFYNSNNGTAQGRLATQVQVIGWLSKIRRQREGSLLSAGSFLSEVLNMQ